ncbi:MAG: hypothetical protein Q9169_002175 [Polycauliona sp. 2 TL-2023]
MKNTVVFVASAIAFAQAAVLPSQFTGAQSGIGSWFETNEESSSTNGNSWCGYQYTDDYPLFAPSLALMGGATYYSNPSAWDQQRREYCGREARVTNRATGKSMLLYIGDSFAQPRSGGDIDIVIGAFIELYGSDPNGNHNLVMNPVDWQFTGNVDPAYTADGANLQSGSSGSTANNTEAGFADLSQETANPQETDCDWGCYGWDCSSSQPCQDQYTCRGGYCKPVVEEMPI